MSKYYDKNQIPCKSTTASKEDVTKVIAKNHTLYLHNKAHEFLITQLPCLSGQITDINIKIYILFIFMESMRNQKA